MQKPDKQECQVLFKTLELVCRYELWQKVTTHPIELRILLWVCAGPLRFAVALIGALLAFLGGTGEAEDQPGAVAIVIKL